MQINMECRYAYKIDHLWGNTWYDEYLIRMHLMRYRFLCKVTAWLILSTNFSPYKCIVQCITTSDMIAAWYIIIWFCLSFVPDLYSKSISTFMRVHGFFAETSKSSRKYSILLFFGFNGSDSRYITLITKKISTIHLDYGQHFLFTISIFCITNEFNIFLYNTWMF